MASHRGFRGEVGSEPIEAGTVAPEAEPRHIVAFNMIGMVRS